MLSNPSATELGAIIVIKDEYLGDGVYASYDGFGIVLDLRGQDQTTKIYLEESVLESLDRYREYIKKRGNNPIN